MNLLVPALLLVVMVQGNPSSLGPVCYSLHPKKNDVFKDRSSTFIVSRWGQQLVIYLISVFMAARGEGTGEVCTSERGGAADKQRGEGWAGPSVRSAGTKPVRVPSAGRVAPCRGLRELSARRSQPVPAWGQRIPPRGWQPDPKARRGAVQVRLGPRIWH